MSTISRGHAFYIDAAFAGVGATVTMDLAGEVFKRATGAEPLDYALLGRWLGHMTHAKFAHPSIANAAPHRFERLIGQCAHYAIGAAIAVSAAYASPTWAQAPRFGYALGVGISSTVAPFLIMQPCFGLGFAASNTSQPWQTRMRSLRSHAIYGVGLYLSAKATEATRRRRSRRLG